MPGLVGGMPCLVRDLSTLLTRVGLVLWCCALIFLGLILILIISLALACYL